jgi:hypothetical protein
MIGTGEDGWKLCSKCSGREKVRVGEEKRVFKLSAMGSLSCFLSGKGSE